ncbi:CoA-transferase family III domain-containing protein [Chytridium lagenaria]|nr:CoA-transferase family III domain-containing protein [Chytridium lagenaria]
MHPLAGIKVLELAGLAPAPFAGMMLADFGADVIRVDRIASSTTDVLGRGKRSISLNLKSEEGRETLKKMMAQADVVIDPFRPGVLEKLGLGPDTILKLNPKCVFARLTGFGQYGDFANMAGHDINYIAISGALSAIGRAGENPMFPANLLGDFAGGGMLCVVGILISLIERQRSGLGQVVDAAMVDGSNYLSAFIIKMRHLGLWNAPRGKNVLDSGAPFYETYRTKDGKFLAVGSIEPQFYKVLLKGLNVDKSELPDQLDTDSFDQVKAKFTEIFLTKTRDEWTKIFNKTDACVTPILEWDEEPRPAPRLSRTPGRHTSRVEQGDPTIGQHTEEVLTEFGFGAKEIQDLKACKAVLHAKL